MGVYNANPPTLVDSRVTSPDQVDTAGSIYSNNEGRKASYRSVASGIVATANGVFLSVQGSASKTIRITRIWVGGVLTTAAQVTVKVNRTTGAVSSPSGTAAITPSLLDTNDAAAAALVNSYTTATIGAGGTVLAVARPLFAPATALATYCEFTFGTRNTKAMVLRGTGDFMQLSFAASGYTGALFDMEVEHTEE